MAMVAVHRKMKEEKVRSKMILQVHDELVFDVHIEEEMIMEYLVKTEMENAVKLVVPMVVELKMAGNWLEAH